MSAIHETLRQARRRMILASLLSDAVRSALWVSLGGLMLMSVLFWLDRPPGDPRVLLAVAVAGLACLAFSLARRRYDFAATARRLDLLAPTHDRFTVGLALSEEDETPLAQLALADCRAFAGRFDPVPLLPVRLPRATWALVAPAAAAVFLVLHYQAAPRIDPATRAAQEELVQKADLLDELRREIAQAAQEDPRLRELAEATEKAAENIRQAARSKSANAKEALKQLSALESMIAALQKALAAQSQALEKAADRAEASDAQGAAAALQAAAENAVTDEERQLLDQAAAEARAAGQMSAEERQRALARLAEQMRQMTRQARPTDQGGGSQRQLQALRNAVQNLKNGRPGEGRQPRNGPGDSNRRSLVQSIGESPKADGPGTGEGKIPGGQPGGELDQGTTDSPFGNQANQSDPAGRDTRLDSILDQGESLSDLVPAAGDTSKSTRRYRALYNAVAADAQATVDREDIPLASRFFIKRYFENIRPTE